VAGDRLKAGSVGQGVVEGQDWDAAAGVAEGGVAQPRVVRRRAISRPPAGGRGRRRVPEAIQAALALGVGGGSRRAGVPSLDDPRAEQPAGGGAALAPKGHVGGELGWP
jgi:hypothetical protein